MKWLLVLLVVAFGIWLWRSRRPPPPAPTRGQKKKKTTAEMVRCAACGLHLPQADALSTNRGSYCSVEHRQQIEGR